MLQMDAGCCPGCGVRLQCEDKPPGRPWRRQCALRTALGYIPPDKFVKPDEEDPSRPLNAEDEVALLLKEDGAEERTSFQVPTTSRQKFFKVTRQVCHKYILYYIYIYIIYSYDSYGSYTSSTYCTYIFL